MESIYEIMAEAGHINNNSEERFIKEKKGIDVAEVLKKLKTCLGIKTNVQLSEALHVCPNTISTWKKRNSLDYSRLIAFGKLHNIDLNRLFSNRIRKEKFYKEVIVVPWEFQYQYVTNFDKGEFLEDMPRYKFPLTPGNGKIRIFQVDHIISFSSFKGDFFAVGEYVNSITDITGEVIYILINKINGFLIGKIEQDSINQDILYIINDQNKIMKNRVKISARDVVEVWKVNTIIFDKV